MLRSTRFWLPVVIVALCCIHAPAFADDVQSGTDGKEIVPIDSKAIRMASERVEVDVNWNDPKARNGTGMHVKALFVLVNETDSPQSISVSFPSAFDVAHFTRTVDDKPVKVQQHQGGEYGNVSQIDFAPKQTRRVRIEYEGDASECSTGEQWWSYIITTGAKWKGTIGEAVVVVRFPKEMPTGGKGPFNFDAITMTPAGYDIDDRDRTVTWTFTDFEPTQDIDLKWSRTSALLASDPFKLASPEESSAMLLEQGQHLELRKALAAYATIREFYPKSAEAKTLNFYIANAFAQEFVYHDLNKLYVSEAIARYEAALKEPLDDEQRPKALCEQFILASVGAQDRAKARTLLERIKKEDIESQASEALKVWGDEAHMWRRAEDALIAYEAVREFFPQSSQAKKIDYNIGCVYASHRADSVHTGVLTLECTVKDATKAVAHYEAALKQPLRQDYRQHALAELLVLYSLEVPDAVKAQRVYDMLLKEKDYDPRDFGLFYKLAAVSPPKSLAVLNTIPADPKWGNDIMGMRHNLEAFLKAHPEGILPRRPTPQTQPATSKAKLPT